MLFDLIDYQPPGNQINRDQTGTFGSYFQSDSFLGKRLSSIKNQNVRLPVLSFAYANALLKGQGHQVRIVTDAIPESSADVAIFATVMYNYREDLEFLRQFKIKHPKTKLGLIGGFSKTMPEVYDGVADFFINSDIELPIQAFFKGTWNWQGTYTSTENVNLKELPIPDWSGFPLERYSYRPALTKKNFLVVQSSRGCVFNCSFCPYMVTQQAKVNNRDIGQIEAEIKYLYHELGVRSILFRDILFGASPSRVEEISDMFIRLNLDIEWASEMHINCLNEKLIAKMASSGWKVVNLGIESSDPEILSKSGKRPINIQRIIDTIATLHKYDIKVQAFYIFGLKEDTAQSMQATLQFAKNLNTFSAQFCVATPFPGTRFFDEVKDQLLHRDWSRYTEYEPVIQLPNVTPDQIREIRDEAYRTYYMRPKWIMRYGAGVVKGILA